MTTTLRHEDISSLTHGSGETDGRTIFRRITWGRFEYCSDLIAHDYMRRWRFKTPWGMLRIHHILRSDDRDHLHDHPMDFVSFILWGGYVEYTPNLPPKKYGPGSVVVRRAEDLHALELCDKKRGAWTLLLTPPFRRKWGFATPDGWIPAGQYDAYKKQKRIESLTGKVAPYIARLEGPNGWCGPNMFAGSCTTGPHGDVISSQKGESFAEYERRVDGWLVQQGIPREVYDAYIELCAIAR